MILQSGYCLNVNLHSIRYAHVHTFFTYLKRIRFSDGNGRKRICKFCTICMHTVFVIYVHFICKYQNKAEQQNSFRCSQGCTS